MSRTITILFILIGSVSCASNSDTSGSGPRPGTITGSLSNSSGPLENAEVKLTSYKDENCSKLVHKQKLSPEEDQQFNQCRQELSSTTSDAQGKYAFSNVSDGWYSLTVNWTTREDPLKSNPMWKPIFLYREDGFLITFIAAKDSSFRMLAVGEPFQFSSTAEGQKDLKLKL